MRQARNISKRNGVDCWFGFLLPPPEQNLLATVIVYSLNTGIQQDQEDTEQLIERYQKQSLRNKKILKFDGKKPKDALLKMYL